MLSMRTQAVKLRNGSFAVFKLENQIGEIFSLSETGERVAFKNNKFHRIVGQVIDEPVESDLQPEKLDIFFKSDEEVLSFEEFDNYFDPILDDEGCGDLMVDTYVEANEVVNNRIKSDKNYRHIWTVVDSGEGYLSYLNGYHVVNKLHYVVTRVPWGTGADSDIEVNIECADFYNQSENK